ncbi:hypothetical protein [Vibrio tritonius]|uniref:hypothetical protein n=1 Tax=Vibrio tritonius TaxID=1435069 RepID=UPI00315CF19A
MVRVVKTNPLINDPRFLLDLTMGDNFNTINFSSLESKKKLIKENKTEGIKEKELRFKERFIQLSDINLNEFTDQESIYFLWFIMVIYTKWSHQIESPNNLFLKPSLIFEKIKPVAQETSPSNKFFLDYSDSKEKINENAYLYLHLILENLNINKQSQFSFIKRINELYFQFKKSNNFKLTLNDNKERAEWISNKLEDYNIRLIRDGVINSKYKYHSLAISLFLWDEKELLRDSDGTIDILGLNNSTCISKDSLLHKLNLAWNQHSHRKLNKVNKVKAYNFEMSTDITKKLNELSKYHDKKKNSLVQYLIEQAYDDMKRK